MGTFANCEDPDEMPHNAVFRMLHSSGSTLLLLLKR